MILLKEHKEVLLRYISNYPHCWKSKIKQDWDSAFCIHSLRAIRNQYGPTWLMNLSANKVKNAEIRS